MRIRSIAAALCFMLVFGGAVFGTGGQAAGATRAERIVASLSAQRLASEFHLSPGEAKTRIERQPGIDRLAWSLRKSLGASFAGAFIDHKDEGRLHVRTTSGPSRAALHLVGSSELGRFVVWRAARYSVGELASMKAELRRRFAQAGVMFVTLAVDERTNKIHVRLPVRDAQVREIGARAKKVGSWAAAADSASQNLARYQRVARSFTGAVSMERVGWNTHQLACYAGTRPACDDPLRGGIAMEEVSPNGFGLCTAGFNAKSRSDGKPYVLTAGHCVNVANRLDSRWQTQMPKDGGLHWIGYWWNGQFNDAGDAGIVTVDNPTGWRPGPYVLVRRSPEGPFDTEENQLYVIRGVRTVSGLTIDGSVLCKTGAVTATTCGLFRGGGIDAGPGRPDNLGHVSAMTCQGDSGGPVYKSHYGYGLVSIAAGAELMPRTVNPGWREYDDPARCFTDFLYQGLAGAQNLRNVDILTG